MKATEFIGPTIVKIIEIKHDIDLLTERLHGAQHPQSIGEYSMQLRQKNETLAGLKGQLKELRLTELLHYQEKLRQVENEIEISTELIDQHDLSELRKEIEKKIETIQKAIHNESE